MKTLKRVIALMLALSMITVLFAGCGKDETAEGDVPTLVWYVPGNQQADIKLVMDEANKIIEPAIGAKLDMRFLDQGAYGQKLDMMMASQEKFDLCFVGWLYGYSKAIQKGGLYDITEIVDKQTKLRELIPDYSFKGATYNGKLYGVPNVQIMATGYTELIRTDLMEKYNFDISKVEKLEDIEPFLDQILANEPELFPADVHWSRFFDKGDVTKTYTDIYSDIIHMDNETGKLIPFYEKEGAKTQGEGLHRWYKKGYIRKDVATLVDNSDYNAGRYALINNMYLPSVEMSIKNMTGHHYTVIPGTIGKGKISTGNTTSVMTAVSATTKNPEKAVKFIELMNSNKELYNLICFGIEGKHYNWVDEDHIKLDKNSGYYHDSAWNFGNQFNAYLQEGQALDEWEKTEEINETAELSPLLGFYADTSSILTELAQLKTVWNKYDIMFNRGTVDPDEYWDQMKVDFEKAGIQKIIDVYQTQIDAFLEANK